MRGLRSRLLADLRLAIFVTTFVLAGCTSLPMSYDGVPSSAFDSPETTTLGRAAMARAAEQQGKSGLRLLETGAEAFRARAALAALAERSIDAQYFIWHSDTMGRLLGGMLIEAAERGVRVRLLVDDFYIGRRDQRIAMFNAHPNIQIRVFNPVATRRSQLSRAIGFVTNLRRLNHRMHNKLFLVDGAFVVAGGRNVGDEYYGVHPEFNMRDRDVLATGPVVAQLGESFDSYWNSRWAVPFEVVVDNPPAAHESAAAQEELLAFARNPPPLPYPVRFSASELSAAVNQVIDELIWADTEVHYDLPEPEDDTPAGQNYARVGDALTKLVAEAHDEVLIQTPYLVPKPRGMEVIEALTARGVKVKVMTNSLASTDMVPAQAAYARYRPEMLATGAEVFELKPDAAIAERFVFHEQTPRPALALHAKTIVVDRRIVYVGTYNLDRRSASLNTEVALVVHSPALARRVATAIETDMASENSWRVVRADDGSSVWIDQRDGDERRHSEPPDSSFGRRLSAGFIGMLPIDEHL